jgi:hypothetical protein
MPLSSSVKECGYYYCIAGALLILKLVGVCGAFPAIIFNVKS